MRRTTTARLPCIGPWKRTRHRPVIETLLAAGADVRARNGVGATPLHLAVQLLSRDRLPATRAAAAILLLAGGADRVAQVSPVTR